jgi:hypothetical protein
LIERLLASDAFADRWALFLGNLYRNTAQPFVVGVEGGLLVLTVYEAAPDGRTSPRNASRAIEVQDDAPSPRNRA